MRIEARADRYFGLYRVVGRRKYRGHSPGDLFEAKLDRLAEQRAIARGDIKLLERVIPELRPGSFVFPEGWLASPSHQTSEAREGLFS